MKPQASSAFDPDSCEPPIHHLPSEILLEIASYCIQSEACLRDLVRLTLVCKRWRVIIEDSSVIWSTINAVEGSTMVRKALRKAEDTTLHLTFDEYTTQMTREEFFKSIGERIEHWRALVVDLKSNNWDFVLEDLKKRNAPNLETLRLSGSTGAERMEGMVTLFEGHPGPPGLRDITLSHIRINLSSLQLIGLKSLMLKNTPTVSFTDILNIITASPNIESIQLRYLEWLVTPLPQQVSNSGGNLGKPSIQLASLIGLALENLPALSVNYLLSIIDAPLLQTLEVDCELERPQDAQNILAGLSNQTPNLARLVADAQMFKLSISNDAYYRIRIGGLDLTLPMDELPLDCSQETLEWVFNQLANPLKDLPSHLDLDDWAPELSKLEWLTRRMNVTKLTLHSDPYFGPPLEAIIPFFSRPTASTPVIWLFPQIEIIETNLVWENGNTDIVEMIKNRHSAGDDKDGATPKPFREIWLSYGGKVDRKPPPVNLDFL